MTTRLNTDAITRERLAEWGESLNTSHATPVLLVGCGHDEHAGEMHIIVTEDCDNATLRAWLIAALRSLE